MAYRLEVSSDAHNDIYEIVGYIANELSAPKAASSFLDDVETSYLRVVDNPHSYSLCSDVRLERLGYRKIVIRNYLMLYRIDEDNQVVYIVRVVYGRRNYPEMI